MVTVIGVRFKKAGKVYYFDPSDIWPRPGENVVVETARGLEMGEVVTSAREVADDQIVAPLKKVIRAALPEDIRRAEYNTQREKDAFPICQERITAHRLDMKLVDVEYTFDGSKIIFYFTADGRVDFRELVKDLASIFKMRIELRQIGVRDEAKMLGGLGACGRPICCGAFLGDFQPLSIKMAKEQNLSLNPVKISGQCGRLMCCLKYEQDFYEMMLKKVPKVGSEVLTPDGPGIVNQIFVIREKVRVRIRTSDDTFDLREYLIDEIAKPGRPLPPRRDKQAEEEAAARPAPVPEAQPSEPVEAPEEAPAEEERPPKPTRRSPRNRSGFKPPRQQKPSGEENAPQQDAAAAEAPAERIQSSEAAEKPQTAPQDRENGEDAAATEPGAKPRRRRRGGRNRHKGSPEDGGSNSPDSAPEE